MAKLRISGLQEYQSKIAKLGKDSEDIVKKAVYDGAKVAADEVKARLEALPAVSNDKALAAYREQKPTNLSNAQKTSLIASFGLAPMRNDFGFINTKVGFDGYNKIKTKKYPNGQPNAMIARSVESGSVALLKSPFVRPAATACKAAAEKAMEKRLTDEIEKIMK